MTIVPFEEFNLRYSGLSCYVVGRGPTRFDYRDLGNLREEPVFFINDAVQMEGYARSDRYYFATDRNQRVWLGRPVASTAVMPINGKILAGHEDPCLHPDLTVCFYQWATLNSRRLLRMNRGVLARVQMLYRGTGTVHPLLHFVWFTGIRKVFFIGCDGLNDPQWLRSQGLSTNGYDARIVNRSNSRPWWQYSRIRTESEELCTELKLEYEFLGAPLQ